MPTREEINTQVVTPPADANHTSEGEATAQTPAVRVGVSRARFGVPSVVLSTLAIIAVIVGLYLLYRLLPVLILVFVAILFATAIEPVVNWLRRGPFNRTAGILVVYTSIFVVIGIIGFLTLPIFFNQIGALGTSLPQLLDNMKKAASGITIPFVREQALSWIGAAHDLLTQAGRSPTNASPQEAVQTTLGIAEGLFSVITFFVVAFYWLTERTLIKRSVTSWFTLRRANRIRRVWDDIEFKVGGWVRGQLTLMLIIGLTSAAGYLLIGVQYWPAMALFIGLCEAIPLVGPYIGTAPAVLVALTQPGNDGLPGLIGMGDLGSVTRALLVVLFAVILQTIEGNVLVPRIMRNSVGISPLTVIISLLIGASLAGLLGALLAVPIAGSVQVILQDIRSAVEQSDAGESAAGGLAPASTEQVEVVVGGNKEPTAQSGTA